MMARRVSAAILLTVSGLSVAMPSAHANLCPHPASPIVAHAADETLYVNCFLGSYRPAGPDPMPHAHVFVGVYRETNGTKGLQTPWTSEKPDAVVVAQGATVQPYCPSIWYIDNPLNHALYAVCTAFPEI